VGAVVKAPSSVRDLSPFHHVPPVPAAGFDPVSAAALVAIGMAFGLVAAWRFAGRDVAWA
jgi:putative exporter of polyketide antibiotics